ncbi:hypothetical protein COB64_04270 [Candidatus Wolfebacteria bacterium]|nr:MAG: hypothetical protein COB64_04270 [Candidatus Wolfebacteria bacterium]
MDKKNYPNIYCNGLDDMPLRRLRIYITFRTPSAQARYSISQEIIRYDNGLPIILAQLIDESSQVIKESSGAGGLIVAVVQIYQASFGSRFRIRIIAE